MLALQDVPWARKRDGHVLKDFSLSALCKLFWVWSWRGSLEGKGCKAQSVGQYQVGGI